MVYRADFNQVPARMVPVISSIVCAWCHKAEKIDGIWIKTDSPFEDENTSHGMCLDCKNICLTKLRRIYD